MDPTTDPTLRSWVSMPADSPFPIQNLPFGVFRRNPGTAAHIGVAIGAEVLDLAVLSAEGVFRDADLGHLSVFEEEDLNTFLAQGRPVWQAARAALSLLLSAGEPRLRDDARLREQALVPQASVQMLLPVRVGDYTDFYSSREHATNVGAMFRGPDKALMPNWLHLPVGYHGRASSVVVSGTDVPRPCGQYKPEGVEAPVFGPTRSLDFELEVAAVVGPGNALGEPIPIDRAEEHVFGLVLLNDWSARDVQAWEYVPLGPFLGKSFATTISPWVVPLAALEPFRVAGPAQAPAPLPYLRQPGPGAFDVHLEVYLQGEGMQESQRICASNFRHLYWSIAQQVAHHTVNGCNLQPGDLLASGTVSGPTPASYGSMLELTWRGSKPLALADGSQRAFLHDGDRVTMTAWCQGAGYRVGFGAVTGKVLPART
jgi:fumarylacetoacetase